MNTKELAQVVANVLGAAEMLNGIAADAAQVIEKVLAAPDLYAEFVTDMRTKISEHSHTIPIAPLVGVKTQLSENTTCRCTCIHTVHPVEHHFPNCPEIGTRSKHRPNCF